MGHGAAPGADPAARADRIRVLVKAVGRCYLIVMIPVIDLGPYLAARPHASAATAAELGRALQDVGLFVIVNHGIPQTLIDAPWSL